MDQSKDNESKSNEFSAIKFEPTMAFDPELEPLLRENKDRFVIFPIKYKDIWEMYKKVRRKTFTKIMNQIKKKKRNKRMHMTFTISYSF